jgi:hypothetical protein
MTFKVGDRVRYIRTSGLFSAYLTPGKVYTVQAVEAPTRTPEPEISVSGHNASALYWYPASDFELANRPPTIKPGDLVQCVDADGTDWLDVRAVYKVYGAYNGWLEVTGNRVLGSCAYEGHRFVLHQESDPLEEVAAETEGLRQRLSSLESGAREAILSLSENLDRAHVRQMLDDLGLLTEHERGLDSEHNLPTWEGAVVITEDGDVAVLVGEKRGKPGLPWALFEHGGGGQPYDHWSYQSVANLDPTVINRAIFPE